MHETMHHAEAEAGAVPRALGGEEGLEGLGKRLFIHASASIDHFDQYVLTELAPRRTRSISYRNRKLAAVGHRITRVVGEIDDSAVELGAVDLDRPQIRRDPNLEHDLLSDRAFQELGDIADPLSGIEHLRREWLPPREGKQAAGQFRTTLYT